MIQFQDYAAPLVEVKSKRKEICLKPTVAATIKRAAGIVGMDESTFITSAAYKTARDVEASQFTTVLNENQFEAFAIAVDEPGKRNEALADIIANSRGLFGDVKT